MKRTYLYLIAPVALLAISSCKSKTDQQAPPPPPTAVSIVEAQQGNAVYYDQYQGTVVAVNSVELRSQVAGFITNIFVKDGDVVQKGQSLYEIDRRKYQAAYDQAQANVSSAQANLVKAQKDIDRYNMLLKADAVARQTVDNAAASFETAKSQVAVAKAALVSASTDLSYSIIKAPFSGRIGISQVKLGAQVTPGTTLLNTISAENPIAVDVVVNEQDIARFYDLQKHPTDSTFRLKLSNDSLYNKSGRILAIDRGVNNQTGTIKVRVQFDNPNDVLRDGMSAQLKVLNNKSGNRIIIPFKAVTEQMGEFFVFVTKDTTMKAKPDTTKMERDTIALQKKVKIGPRLNDNVVIMSGIKQGDKVITEGFQRLRDSGKVTLGPIKPAAGAPAKQKN
ncbi:efflux RND transporter periplasmic adaptor subunit [Mucilaginibacter mali]|uniref:Efflux RND transporter periplasmic adaptor subunit n=1 Tax=Mucilaginibacter mali TaxID=2740462 RepID=A0A7D4TVX3_9SPHI|nr:efflux RND transporter periplasmic adaptor subunit [Mucilaginibacter mali]QKJ30895.1 efflux RND transporter periplasmic adaptor subunit [Mucilaginibacter mali]